MERLYNILVPIHVHLGGGTVPKAKDYVLFKKTYLGKTLNIILLIGVGLFIGFHVYGFFTMNPFIGLYVPWILLLIPLVGLLVLIQALTRRHELKEHDHN